MRSNLLTNISMEKLKWQKCWYYSFDSAFKKLRNDIISKVKKIWPLKNFQTILFLRRVFVYFWLIFREFRSEKSPISIKTNMIFGISIKNWVDPCMIRRFSRTFVFIEKFTPGPPQGLDEKMNCSKIAFGHHKETSKVA